MPKFKCPFNYPAKSRKDMIAFLTYIGGHCTMHNNYPLAFNVKAYGVDLSFDHLWQEYHAKGQGDMTPKPSDLTFQGGLAYRKLCEEQYADNEELLFDWAIEDARRSVSDGDCYRMTWHGKLADVKFGFIGRQGGWLVIEEFEGFNLSNVYNSEFEDVLKDMPFETLSLLYRLAVQWEEEFTRKRAEEQIEYYAASTLFVNLVEPEWQ